MATIPTLTFHPEYTKMQPFVKAVRTAVLGSPFVKEAEYDYLPHPSQVDTSSQSAKARYAQYLAGAEFDEFPKSTIRSWLGKMKFSSAEITLPAKLEYLRQSVDNDGTSLTGAIEASASNCLQAKYHVLVADYNGLTGVDITQVSKAEVAALNPRATIKQYNRESLVWWDFQRINDAMQLVFVMLREVSLEFDTETFTGKDVESFLILALDENGNYFQQKIVKNLTSSGYEEGEREYVTVRGQMLKWLPVEIVADEEMTPGKLPMDLGYLAPICDLAYVRYRVSAEYKEAIRMIPPTVNTTGFTEQNWELFKQMNGREYIAVGIEGNALPEGCVMDVAGGDVAVQGYERYFKDNEAKVRALGGVFPTVDSVNDTATGAIINATDQTSRLMTLAEQLESAWSRALLYCGMFEGLWAPDAIEQNLEQVMVKLNKDFAQSKLTDAQVNTILNLQMSGLYPNSEIVAMLVQGGWSVSSAEELINMQDSGE